MGVVMALADGGGGVSFFAGGRRGGHCLDVF